MILPRNDKLKSPYPQSPVFGHSTLASDVVTPTGFLRPCVVLPAEEHHDPLSLLGRRRDAGGDQSRALPRAQHLILDLFGVASTRLRT